MPKTEEQRPQSSRLGLNDTQFEEIATMIRASAENNNVVAVKAPTGSGKSTYMVASFLQNRLCKRIIVVVPTILAAESLSRYMAGQYENIYTVGCGADSRRNYNDTTQIVYCTTGHMLSLLMTYVKAPATSSFAFDMIMIDEAHSDSADYTTIMCLVRHLRGMGRSIPTTVLASATIVPEMTPFSDCPVYEIQTQGHPIEIIYHPFDLRDNALIMETAKVINKFNMNLPLNEKNAIFIVFMSGSNECEVLAGEIKENYANSLHPWEIHTIYGQKTTDDGNATDHRARVLEPPKPNHRKVIIATNVAESSVTIPDARLVICTGKQKMLVKTPNGGTRLEEVSISKSSANQRKGRTGRTCAGTIYRMYTESNYNSRPQLLEPEIKRVNPARTILPILDVGLIPEAVFEGYLKIEEVQETVDHLKKLQMVDDDLNSTLLGKFICNLPFGVYEGALLWHLLNDARLQSFKFQSIGIVCAIANYGPTSYFAYPRASKGIEEVYFNEKFSDFVDGCDTEIEVLGQILQAYFSRFGTNIQHITSGEINRWCNQKAFFAPAVEKMLKAMRDVVKRLTQYGMKIDVPDEFICGKEYYQYFYENTSRVYMSKIYQLMPHYGSDKYKSVDGVGPTYRISNKKVLMYHRDLKDKIVVLSTHSFTTPTGVITNLITLHIPYTLEEDY